MAAVDRGQQYRGDSGRVSTHIQQVLLRHKDRPEPIFLPKIVCIAAVVHNIDFGNA